MTGHVTGHAHGGHAHGTATGAHRRRLAVVLAITLAVMVGEVVGALVSGSLALLADAGHMLTDASGIAIALFASWLAGRPATTRRTFGWQRAEILAALANGLLLAAVAVTVVVEGVARVAAPEPEIQAGVMIAVAVVGLVANAVGLRLLSAGQAESLNVRGAYLEVLGDLLGSVAVVAAGVAVAAGFPRADGIASVAIGLMILPRAVLLLRDVAHVLLEATPPGVDLDAVREHMEGVPGVVGVHDLHAWTITSGVPVLSAHVEVEAERIERGEGTEVLRRLKSCLSGHFDVDHCTFQIEPPDMRRTEASAHH
ncbi:cation diffusion facilitator family transporter [Cellulosimicrobium marinum]|uniref:cation diffusion facilitator family transporter n=1 Tax=Cellulosimicrobium marinum TaxID=1638992 RepID=UPI001E3009A2|nr:cation diffusion facilitator family transporter [Cellulosimicrobium marinum]MCB7135195.1 cation diffusion facilitator family transporter [Cellulosimicrobium marinum]